MKLHSLLGRESNSLCEICTLARQQFNEKQILQKNKITYQSLER